MKSNTKYSVREPLPTMNIDVTLLKSIENYLFNSIPKLIGISGTKKHEYYKISIVDAHNELTLATIDSYEHELLPPKTNEVRVVFNIHNVEKDTSVNIEIRFTKDQFSSKVRLELTSLNSKELATGILAKVREILDQKRNHNWLFQPSLKLYPVMLILIVGIGYLSRYTYKNNAKWSTIDMLVNILMITYLFLFSRLKPYMAFDTRVQRNNDKWAGVLLWGIPSFIIFGFAVPKILDFLIGK